MFFTKKLGIILTSRICGQMPKKLKYRIKKIKCRKKKQKKAPFSVYWIYAAIALAVIGFQVYLGSDTNGKIQSQSSFFELAEQGYIDEVEIVNKERVDFKLNEDGKTFVKNSTKGEFKQMSKAFEQGGRLKNHSPTFEFEIVDAGNFEKTLTDTNDELEEAGKDQIPYSPRVEVNYLQNILGFLVPILLVVLLWLFVMRRMTGGSGG